MTEVKPPRSLVEQYRQSFSEHGDTPAGVQWPRGRQSLRFDALTRHFPSDNFSVLDYGCGLGHLKPYLDQRFDNVEYRGADLVPEFINAASAKFPNAKILLIDSHDQLTEPVDHVVISGTFNIIEGDDRDAYLDMVKQTLLHLFALSQMSLSINFMTDQVDFMQPGALHVNPGEMMEFMRAEMSPRILVDSSYMPYEFTLVVFKDSEIQRPDNIYRVL